MSGAGFEVSWADIMESAGSASRDAFLMDTTSRDGVNLMFKNAVLLDGDNSVDDSAFASSAFAGAVRTESSTSGIKRKKSAMYETQVVHAATGAEGPRGDRKIVRAKTRTTTGTGGGPASFKGALAAAETSGSSGTAAAAPFASPRTTPATDAGAARSPHTLEKPTATTTRATLAGDASAVTIAKDARVRTAFSFAAAAAAGTKMAAEADARGEEEDGDEEEEEEEATTTSTTVQQLDASGAPTGNMVTIVRERSSSFGRPAKKARLGASPGRAVVAAAADAEVSGLASPPSAGASNSSGTSSERGKVFALAPGTLARTHTWGTGKQKAIVQAAASAAAAAAAVSPVSATPAATADVAMATATAGSSSSSSSGGRSAADLAVAAAIGVTLPPVITRSKSAPAGEASSSSSSSAGMASPSSSSSFAAAAAAIAAAAGPSTAATTGSAGTSISPRTLFAAASAAPASTSSSGKRAGVTTIGFGSTPASTPRVAPDTAAVHRKSPAKVAAAGATRVTPTKQSGSWASRAAVGGAPAAAAAAGGVSGPTSPVDTSVVAGADAAVNTAFALPVQSTGSAAALARSVSVPSGSSAAASSSPASGAAAMPMPMPAASFWAQKRQLSGLSAVSNASSTGGAGALSSSASTIGAIEDDEAAAAAAASQEGEEEEERTLPAPVGDSDDEEEDEEDGACNTTMGAGSKAGGSGAVVVLTAHKVAQRVKQIEKGYASPEYTRYAVAVPKASRERSNPLHPQTPDRNAAVTKRRFDGRLRAWRRDLHLWDAANTAAAAAAGTSAGAAAAATTAEIPTVSLASIM